MLNYNAHYGLNMVGHRFVRLTTEQFTTTQMNQGWVHGSIDITPGYVEFTVGAGLNRGYYFRIGNYVADVNPHSNNWFENRTTYGEGITHTVPEAIVSITEVEFRAHLPMYAHGVHAHGVQLTSDDRLKINEELIQNATNTLLKLRPQIYDKKTSLTSLTSTDTIKEAGLIAQEVYYEIPELRYLVNISNDATLIDDNKYRNFDDIRNDPDYNNWGNEQAYLNYIGLIPYLIQGFKEVNVEIEKLKTEVSTLKQENIQQQAKIETLEANTMN